MRIPKLLAALAPRVVLRLAPCLALCLALCGCGLLPFSSENPAFSAGSAPDGILEDAPSASDLPAYKGDPCVEVNGNVPGFDDEDKDSGTFEAYSGLDRLGRCGAACAMVGPETVNDTERPNISDIKPSGWDQESYDGIEGGVLYNRSHLIMRALGGDDDRRNLITGTRFLNATLMLNLEEEIFDYVYDEGGHVLYRVTPLYQDSELVARAVQMEAFSIEDNGRSICVNVIAYNVQPGVEIDYATGESRASRSGYAIVDFTALS